jgi:signal transduction histidine kinase/ActR/RegA family two-component response regulator
MDLSALERMTRLMEVTAALSRTLEPDQVGEVVMTTGLTAVGARGGALLRSDPEAHDWVLLECANGRPKPAARLSFGSDVALAVCARTGRGGPMGPWGLCLPLFVRGHVIGALAVDFVAGDALDRDDRAFLEAMADQCAQALERARLFATERVRREELERSNRMKDDFFGIVSHELRTPLSAILGWSRMLRHGMLGTAALRERALDAIERNAALQTRLVDDLLDVSRIVSGKLALETSTVDLAVVIEAAIDSVRPALLAKHVDIGTTLTLAASVRGDFRRLQQALWNVLTNAIKFTPRGGRIDIWLEHHERTVSIAIEDSGVGIPADVLPHVFERFKQADGTTTRKYGGLGLGLSIVRHVIEAHGGEVRAHSEGEGRGTRIVIDLPLPDSENIARDGRDGAADGASLTARLLGARVLLVDDDADMLEFLGAALETAGALVRTTDGARSALEALGDFRPHVIVADIAMPEVDGYAFIRNVRALAADAGGLTPALALSALAQPADRARAVSAGFHMHVPKPVDPGDLVVTIASLLAPDWSADASARALAEDHED